MMILMHDSDRYGYLSMNGSVIPSESVARRCGCDSLAQYESLLSELTHAGVPERSKEGVIFSRRMVRDDKKRKDAVAYGKKGGNPNLKATLNPPHNVSTEVEVGIESSAESEGEREGKHIPDNLNTPDFVASWKTWECHRREIKKKITPSMKQAALKKLSSYGPSRAIQIIEYTISKGWQGLADEHQVPIVISRPLRQLSTGTEPVWTPTK